jgi:rhamnosyltransferase
VFIPTYNGDEYLHDLLTQVFSQRTDFVFEVIVIDSGSKDRTVQIVEEFPDVILHKIPNSEFGHGKTRNHAARMARGQYMVYLSQDAVPASDKWLDFMVEPFVISDRVYCVFGKQTPRPFADAPTKREVSGVFNSLGPDHSIMLARKNNLVTGEELGNYLTFFSDVNSAVRRDYLLNKIPYRDVPYSEDQLLGSDVLDEGYLKAYAPLGNVWHSNEYSLRDYFYRKFDEYLGMYNTLGILPQGGRLSHAKRWFRDTLTDVVFILSDKDYSLGQKAHNLSTSWLRNYYRQKASLLVTKPVYRDAKSDKYSLEKKNSSGSRNSRSQ